VEVDRSAALLAARRVSRGLEGATTRAAEYAEVRYQFERPIGSSRRSSTTEANIVGPVNHGWAAAMIHARLRTRRERHHRSASGDLGCPRSHGSPDNPVMFGPSGPGDAPGQSKITTPRMFLPACMSS
jgi:hypothetical protein